MEKERIDRERAEWEHKKQIEDRKEQFIFLEHKRKMEQMELEAKLQRDQLQISSEFSTQGAGTQHPVKGPKLPAFDDSKHNIDAYI
jgi:hypothetical protein